jgi:hypothetical protein
MIGGSVGVSFLSSFRIVDRSAEEGGNWGFIVSTRLLKGKASDSSGVEAGEGEVGVVVLMMDLKLTCINFAAII